MKAQSGYLPTLISNSLQSHCFLGYSTTSDRCGCIVFLHTCPSICIREKMHFERLDQIYCIIQTSLSGCLLTIYFSLSSDFFRFMIYGFMIICWTYGTPLESEIVSPKETFLFSNIFLWITSLWGLLIIFFNLFTRDFIHIKHQFLFTHF